MVDTEAVLAWAYAQVPVRHDLRLDRVREALRSLGDPQRAFPALLIAGTNGKGSTCAFVEAALRASGLRTGRFTSPHLFCFSERIQLSGAPLPLVQLCARLADYRQRIERGDWPRLSFFELSTVLAFACFAEAEVDVAVVEVGLGGRLDATNTLEPELSLLTQVGLDHQAYLGDTLAAIAREKVAIGRPQRPMVVGELAAEAAEVVRRHAASEGLHLFEAGTSFRSERRGEHLQVTLPSGTPVTLKRAATPLDGSAALALVAYALWMGERAQLAVAAEAIGRCVWPCRYELLRARGRPWLLDGAHNAPAAEALAGYLRTQHASLPHPRLLLFGALADKDIDLMLRSLAPEVDALGLVSLRNARAATLPQLRHLAAAHFPAPAIHEVSDALQDLPPAASYVVCGSLFHVSAVRARLYGQAAPRQVAS